MAWFRLYTDVAHDPKVQRLSPAIFKFWITILCLAKENGGIVPARSDVSFVSHRRQSRVRTDIAVLAGRVVSAGNQAGPPGSVLSVDDVGVPVATGSGVYRIEQVVIGGDRVPASAVVSVGEALA